MCIILMWFSSFHIILITYRRQFKSFAVSLLVSPKPNLFKSYTHQLYLAQTIKKMQILFFYPNLISRDYNSWYSLCVCTFPNILNLSNCSEKQKQSYLFLILFCWTTWLLECPACCLYIFSTCCLFSIKLVWFTYYSLP